NAMLQWVKITGLHLGIVIVTERSVSYAGKKKPKVWLQCERAGAYRNHHSTPA
ncbi:hypothetical protein Dimus_018596, partial [Dionaea muscipula]